MSESRVNRRDFFFGLAGAGAGAWLAAHGSELRAIAAYAASVAPEQAYEFFTPDQAREFDAIRAKTMKHVGNLKRRYV